MRTSLGAALAGLSFVLSGMADAGSAIPAGSYEIGYRLELPHVERWAVTRTMTVCLPEPTGAKPVVLPVLSPNHPFAGCRASSLRHHRGVLTYEIICPARDSARALASYRLHAGGFDGRIAMIMGAKNMTMTEVQVGRRTGTCDLAGTQRLHGFSLPAP